jgi:hypothetical protein
MPKNKLYVEVVQFLTLILSLGIASIIFQQTADNLERFAIIIAISVLYVFWGYWHHAPKDRMLKMILLEYSLVAVMIILLSALGLGIIRFF